MAIFTLAQYERVSKMPAARGSYCWPRYSFWQWLTRKRARNARRVAPRLRKRATMTMAMREKPPGRGINAIDLASLPRRGNRARNQYFHYVIPDRGKRACLSSPHARTGEQKKESASPTLTASGRVHAVGSPSLRSSPRDPPPRHRGEEVKRRDGVAHGRWSRVRAMWQKRMHAMLSVSCPPCIRRSRHTVPRGRILTRVRANSAARVAHDGAGITVLAARRQNASAARRYAGKTLNLPSLCSMRHVQLARVRRKGRARVASREVFLKLPRYGAAPGAPESAGLWWVFGAHGRDIVWYRCREADWPERSVANRDDQIPIFFLGATIFKLFRLPTVTAHDGNYVAILTPCSASRSPWWGLIAANMNGICDAMYIYFMKF